MVRPSDSVAGATLELEQIFGALLAHLFGDRRSHDGAPLSRYSSVQALSIACLVQALPLRAAASGKSFIELCFMNCSTVLPDKLQADGLVGSILHCRVLVNATGPAGYARVRLRSRQRGCCNGSLSTRCQFVSRPASAVLIAKRTRCPGDHQSFSSCGPTRKM